MTRVRFNTPLASPTRSARAGQIVDLPAEEAEQRVKARQCVYVDTPPVPGGTTEGDSPEPDAPQDDVVLEKLTVEQLKAYAAEQEISLDGAGKKAEILDRITTVLAEREADEDGGDGG